MTVRKTIGFSALGLSAGLALAVLGGLGDRTVTIAQLAPTPTATPSPSNPEMPDLATSPAVATEMLKLAGVTRDDVVYDLGSGDGQLVITAVKDYDARRGVGVALNADRVRVSNENAQKAGVSDRAQFLQQDLQQTNLREASVVVLNVSPDLALRLRPRLLSDLKPGTRLVARTAALGDWKPDKTVTVSGAAPQTLYYWVVPERIAGDWQGRVEYAPGRGQAYTLRFTQQFQQVKGNAIADGKTYAIPNITLTGDHLTFSRSETVQGQQGVIQFNGRIAGDMLKGTAGVKWGVLARNFPIVAQRSTSRQAAN